METFYGAHSRAYLMHLIPGEREGLRRYRIILEEITGNRRSLHFANIESLAAYLREQEAQLVDESQSSGDRPLP